KEAAIDAIGQCVGAEAKPLVPQFIEAAKGKNDAIRKAAIRTLGEIGPEGKACVPVLLEALNDKDEAVQKLAIEAIGKVGAATSEAIPLLVPMLKDPRLSYFAAMTFADIGADTPAEAIGPLVEMLKDKDKNNRFAAAKALGSIGGPAKQAAFQPLLQTYRD